MVDYSVHTDNASLLRTDNPFLVGYWRMGDSLPPEPDIQPTGVDGSGWLTDDSLYRKHLTFKSITSSDFDIVQGLVPYEVGGGSGLKLQISSSPTNKRIFLPASDVALNRGQLVPSEFNKPSGFTITGWISVPVPTGHRDGHIINMVENPESMGAGDVFSIAWDGATTTAGHVKFSMRIEGGSNHLVRADQFPTIIDSGLFFAARYRNFAPVAPGGESGIMELFVGSHSSGLVLADSTIITHATSVGIALPGDTEKPLSFGIKAHHDASFINTGAFVPDGSTIDDISFWYTGLTYDQIAHIQNSGITVIDRDIQPTAPGTSGLLAYWKFDNNDDADSIGINSYAGTGDRFNLLLSSPGDVTPVVGINVDGVASSGIQINTISPDFSRSLHITRNSGFPDLFPSKDNGDFTILGWHKFSSANFKSWFIEWVHEDIIDGTRPNTIMVGQGTFLNNSLFGQGVSEYDASGELRDVTTLTNTLGATLDVPKQEEWNLYAGVWDNTNGMMYVVKNARKVIGVLEISPSGVDRTRFDQSTPGSKVSLKFLKLINDPQDVIFDEWAIYNRTLSLPEMSGYALSGIQLVIPPPTISPLLDSPDPRLLSYYGLSVSGTFGNNSPRFEDESYYRHHLDEIVGDFIIADPLEDNSGAGESGALQILSSGSYLNLARSKLGANFDFSQRELWENGWSAGTWLSIPSGGTLNFDEHDLFFMGLWNTSGSNQRSWALATSGGQLSARFSMESTHYAFVSPSSLPLDTPIFVGLSALKSEAEGGTLVKLYTSTSGVTDVSVSASGIIPSFDFDKSSNSGLLMFAIPEYANLDGDGSNFAGCPSGTTMQSAFIFAEDIGISGMTNIKNATVNKITLTPATVSSSDSSNISHWKLDVIDNTIRDFGQEQNHLTIQGSQNISVGSGIHNSGLQVDDFTWLQTEFDKTPIRLDVGSGTDSFTILGWAAIFEEPVDTEKVILAKGGLDGSGYRMTRSNDNILTFESDINTGSGNNSPIPLGSGTDTVFNHLAFIYNRTLNQTTTVVNGRYAGSTFDPLSSIVATTSGFALAGNSVAPGVVDPFTGGANTSGLFDDFMVFDRELTLAEISGLARDSYNFVESAGSASGTLVGAYLTSTILESISDLVGGFLHGKGSEFDIVGGYVSGIEGGFDHIGGFIHGKLISSGIAGAWAHGMGQASGLFGAYVRGLDIGSGVIGSYVLGGCEASSEFDITFTFTILTAQDFDARMGVELTANKSFDARIAVIQITQPPICAIISPTSGLAIDGVPYTLTLQASGIAQNNKKISHVRFTWSDFTPANSGTLVSGLSNSGVFEASHTYWTPGFFTPKIEVIDEFGYYTSCCYQLMIAPTGIASGDFASSLPQLELLVNDADGGTQHDVNFTTLASGAPILMDELDFADGQTTLVNSTEMPSSGPYSGIVRQHTYTMPGSFCAVWSASGTEGIMTDTLRIGNDFEGF